MAVKDKIVRGVNVFERLADEAVVDAARKLVARNLAYWTPEPLTPGVIALVNAFTGAPYVTVRWSKNEFDVSDDLRLHAARV